jgi:hypothetical protein
MAIPNDSYAYESYGNAWAATPGAVLTGSYLCVGVYVDNPPVNYGSMQVNVAAAWAATAQSEKESYQFFGGHAPYMPNGLPPSIIAIPVNNPVIALPQTERPYDGWWIPADLAPQLQVKLSQGPPPQKFTPSGPNVQQDVLAYYDIAAPIVTGRQLPAAVLAVLVSNPPFGRPAPSLSSILTTWISPDAQAPKATALNPAVSAVPANNPPFGVPPLSARAVFEAWQPPSPQAPVAGNLSPAVSAVPVNNPPFGLPPFSSAAILTAWAPTELLPALPRVQRKLADGIVSSAAPWLETVVGTWTPADPAPIVKAPLTSSLVAVAIGNPPFGVPSLSQRTILEAWQSPPAQAPVGGSLNPSIAAVAVNTPPLGLPPPSAPEILAAWISPDAQAPVARALNPAISAVSVSLPPVSSSADNQLAAGGSWPALPDPPPVLLRYLPASVTSVPASNAPGVYRPFVAGVPDDPLPVLPRRGVFAAPPSFVPSSPALTPILAAWAGDVPLVTRTLLNPTLLAVPVNNAPAASGNQLADGGIWPLPEPLPVLPRYLPASTTGVPVNVPPVRNQVHQYLSTRAWIIDDPVAITQRAQAPIQPVGFIPPSRPQVDVAGWASDAAAVTRPQLDPAFLAVPANNPPPRQVPQGAVLASWIPADPTPAVSRFVPRASIAAATTQAIPPAILETIVGSWTLDQQIQVLPKKLNPSFEAVRADNPPVSGSPASTPTMTDVLPSWAAAEQLPWLPRATLQTAPSGFIPARRPWMPGIIDAWAHEPSQADGIAPRNLEVSPAQNISRARAAYLEIFASWSPPDQMPLLPRNVIAHLIVPFVGAPQFSIIAVVDAWASLDNLIPAIVRPVSIADETPENNPPFGLPRRRSLLNILSSWAEPSQQLNTLRICQPIAQFKVLIDPRYIVKYPAPTRTSEYPASVRTAQYPLPIRTAQL